MFVIQIYSHINKAPTHFVPTSGHFRECSYCVGASYLSIIVVCDAPTQHPRSLKMA